MTNQSLRNYLAATFPHMQVGGLDRLSPREAETLLSLGEGLTIKSISYQMGISPKTVESFREQIKVKLDVDGRELTIIAALVRFQRKAA